MDGNPPDSSVHEILQERILEWVAIPSTGDLPNQGIEPGSPALQADSFPYKGSLLEGGVTQNAGAMADSM